MYLPRYYGGGGSQYPGHRGGGGGGSGFSSLLSTATMINGVGGGSATLHGAIRSCFFQIDDSAVSGSCVAACAVPMLPMLKCTHIISSTICVRVSHTTRWNALTSSRMGWSGFVHPCGRVCGIGAGGVNLDGGGLSGGQNQPNYPGGGIGHGYVGSSGRNTWLCLELLTLI